MSRSAPHQETKNPATRWFEWKSTEKCFSWYDKEEKKNVLIKLPFTFLFLDRMTTIRGFNKKLKSGIYSNEIRDTRDQPLIVKYFAGGVVAEGLWGGIKDTVVARSGKFALNLYIAYREGKELKIGCIQAAGCCCGAWFDFEKEATRKVIEQKAVKVAKTRHDTSGDVEFNAPVFELAEVAAETNAEAVELDKALQEHFEAYFKKPTAARVKEGEQADAGGSAEQTDAGEAGGDGGGAPESDDVPF